MPRLVLSLDGVVLREVPLVKERMTIGRRSHNDLVIDNLAVSGEHAVLIQAGGDVYLEDLGSTNGTTVNGQPIKKHLLQSGDVIEIGKYKLKYLADGASGETEVDIDTSQPLRREFYGPGPATIPVRQPGAQAAVTQQAVATIKILSGANAGRELPLVKALTTIGRPGHQVAVITRRPTGYFIAHVEGETFPTVNGVNVGSAAHPLRDKDIIELAGVKIEFNNPGGAA
ncbi:MAG: FHA domain-containing protein [Sutterellaceae bacterium]|nr:FHA domain-containing protein [Burkholderiaceae bacterium]MCX7901870.1 FHA domain-containing protein [Burkholderiaceae bacterium]MDW8429938.1 FHA domain-containing protein [Sutterellaceae bacterium]